MVAIFVTGSKAGLESKCVRSNSAAFTTSRRITCRPLSDLRMSAGATCSSFPSASAAAAARVILTAPNVRKRFAMNLKLLGGGSAGASFLLRPARFLLSPSTSNTPSFILDKICMDASVRNTLPAARSALRTSKIARTWSAKNTLDTSEGTRPSASGSNHTWMVWDLKWWKILGCFIGILISCSL